MKKLQLLIGLFCSIHLFGQQPNFVNQKFPEIRKSDSLRWSNIPQLMYDKTKDTKSLPERLDNSTNSYFPDILKTPQSIANCGQFSGVRNAYSYELNRLLKRTAKTEQNIFSTTFNVISTAHGYAENTLKTWENMKSIGCLTETDLPQELGNKYAMDNGDSKYLNGYDWYYKAMQNQVDDYFSIPLNSEEGILTMKHWLHDHLEGDSVGGIGIIYVGMHFPLTVISTGYDTGKTVLTEFTTYPSHSLAIVGYDDRIEWDYNQDGQITNDIDITGDGIVDVRDWEKGAVILANSYGDDWANNGFVYAMYRTLAFQTPQNGIWNSSMYVVKPKLPSKPKVSFRFSMEHQNKWKIAVYAGVSQNPNSTSPDFAVEIPFLKNIQYNSSISADTTGISTPIEFGFDVTPFLNYLNPNSNARFFLQILEVDPDNKYSGSVKSFSIIDYTHGAKEVLSNSQPVRIVNNGLTTLFVNITPDFSKPQLIENQPPKVTVGAPYQYQLTATHGTPPYRFKQSDGYLVSTGSHTVSDNNGLTQVVFPSGSNTSIAVNTQFPIQVYDSIHTGAVYINPHGYIQLHKYEYHWPFNNLDYTQLKGHTTIAPLMSSLFFDKPDFGVWYKSTPDSLYVRWKGRFECDSNSVLDFSTNIDRNGNITFAYDTMRFSCYSSWVRGISKGNGVELTKIGSDYVLSSNTDYKFEKISTDTSVCISSDGLISFLPEAGFTNKNLNITLLDNNDIETKGAITLSSTEGSDLILASYSFPNGNQQWFSPRDTIYATVTVRNNSNALKQNVRLSMQTVPYLDLMKSVALISEIGSNSTVTVSNAFIFKPNSLLESELPEYNNTISENNQSIGAIKTNLTPFIPIEVGEMIVDSAQSNIIRPNSTHTLLIPVLNKNRFPVYSLNIALTSSTPEATLQNGTFTIDSIGAFSNDTLKFVISTQNLNSPDMLISFNGILSDEKGMNVPFAKTYLFNSTVMESYENMQQPFIIPSIYTDTLPIQIAGRGFDSQKSWLIARPVGSTGKYFFKREFCINSTVNSAIKFDYLNKNKAALSIKRMKLTFDNVAKSIDSSMDWKPFEIPISKGVHSFKIELDLLSNSDSIFIDNLVVPGCTSSSDYHYQIDLPEVKLKCKPDTTLKFNLELTGYDLPATTLDYQIVSSVSQKCEWLSKSGVVVLSENQTREIDFSASSQGLSSGIYTSYIRFYDNSFYTPVKVSLEVIEDYHPPVAGSVLVYPNPAMDKVSFDFISSDAKTASLTLFDMLGRSAFYQEQNIDFGSDLKTLMFDISSVSEGNSTKGLYLYQLKVGDSLYHGKITIIK